MLRSQKLVTNALNRTNLFPDSIVVHHGEPSSSFTKVNLHVWLKSATVDGVNRALENVQPSTSHPYVWPTLHKDSCSVDALIVFINNCYDDRWYVGLKSLPIQNAAATRKLLPKHLRAGSCSVNDVYANLCMLAGYLDVTVPIRTFKWRKSMDRYVGENGHNSMACMPFDDFDINVKSMPKFGVTAKITMWNMCASQSLVFFNARRQGHEQFAMTILDGRYILRGAIVLQGCPRKGDGGSHYVAIYQQDDKSWMRYDSLDGSKQTLSPDKLDFLFRETQEPNGTLTIPAMYFYSRLYKKSSSRESSSRTVNSDPPNDTQTMGMEISIENQCVARTMYMSDGSIHTKYMSEPLRTITSPKSIDTTVDKPSCGRRPTMSFYDELQ